MNIRKLLSRADDQTLQLLLGGPALELILTLDPLLASPAKLTDLILELYTPEGLLRDPHTRALIIDLLRPPETAQLAAILGVRITGGSYERLKNLQVRKGSGTERAFYDYFGLVAVGEEPYTPEPVYETGFAGYALFPHQREAARSVQSRLTDYPRRVVLHMPTGSGKTRTAMNVICEHLREQEPGLVIWLAFSEELCEQAAQEFEEAWKHLGNRPVDVFRFWGDRFFEPEDEYDGIIIAGLSKLYNAARRSIRFISRLGHLATMVIIDEAHSAIAETYSFVLEALVVQHPTTALIGLTATPGRTWADIDIDQQLADFFARKKVALQIPNYNNPIDYLVDQGYLADVTYRPLLHEGGVELTESDIARIQSSLDIPDAILRRFAEDRLRNLAVILEIEHLAKEHKRIIVFAATVEHSDLLAAVLRARGIKADSVTSYTNTIARARTIETFKCDDGDVRILCNYGVLTMGFDAPRTSAALIARPTKSLVLYSQMVGRAIRGVKAGGNLSAEIVTVVDYELPGFGSVAEAFTNWEDVWE